MSLDSIDQESSLDSLIAAEAELESNFVSPYKEAPLVELEPNSSFILKERSSVHKRQISESDKMYSSLNLIG
jgi:hypothetical protein